MQDGQVVTWGQDPDGERWAVWDEWTYDGATGTGERWDAAVRWFFESLDESGIRSAFWDAAGHGEMEASHLSRGAKRWFDHVFVSGDFQVNDCRYLHAFREDGYSDHSALIAELSYAPNKRINLSRPGAAVVSSDRSPRRLCAVLWAPSYFHLF
jgi:hypothetical protein